jgi:SAM-dependent methyltransferase
MSPSSNWNNKTNSHFYENVSLNIHKEHVKFGGISNGEDLEVIKPYILNAKSILEIGAGYGRVLEYLLKNKSAQCEISAVEKSSAYYKELNENFVNTVKLYNTDLLDFNSTENYDLILWMASGISDFAQHEQLIALNKIVTLLKSDGFLILDTFSPELTPVNVTSFSDQTYSAEIDGYNLNGYIPSVEEIENYISQLPINKISHIPYKTATNRNRNIFVLGK